MQFFKEKPLSLIVLIMLGGFSVFTLDIFLLSVSIAITALLLLLTNIVVKKVKNDNYSLHIALLVAFIIATALSYFYFCVHYTLPEKESVIEAEIIDYDHSEYSACYHLRCREIDGKRTNLKIVFYADKDFEGMEIGDIIVTKADITPFQQRQSTQAYYYAKGYVASADHVSNDIAVISHKNNTLRSLLKSIRSNIQGYILDVFGEDAGGLFLALIIGDKEYLNPICRLDFNRIGIAHILALSGQHLAILSLLIHHLLALCRVNKKWRLGILCVFVLLYMTLTGFTPSVTRAGLMLIFASFAFLLGNSYDITTGLFCSVFLFVCIQPYSITDTSLLLSAFATFGVIRAIQWIEGKNRKRGKLFSAIVAPIVISCFSMLYTSFLMVSRFSYISTLSPITSLVFSLLIQIFIYACLALALIGLVLPVKGIAIILYKGIQIPASFISSVEFGYFSTDFVLCTVFSILLCFALLYYLLYPVKRKKIIRSVIFALCASIYLTAIIGTVSITNKDELIYSNEAECSEEAILMKENGNITLIDVLPSNRVAYAKLLLMLEDENIPHIDDYVLIGYQDNAISHFRELCTNIKIHNAYLPSPKTPNEEKLFNKLCEIANKFNISLKTYDTEQFLAFEGSKIYITQLSAYEDTYSPIFTVEYKSNKHLYLGQGAIDEYTYNSVFLLMKECNTVIFGAKGEESEDFLNLTHLPPSIQTVIISNNNNYLEEDLYTQLLSYGKLYTGTKRLRLN